MGGDVGRVESRQRILTTEGPGIHSVQCVVGDIITERVYLYIHAFNIET